MGSNMTLAGVTHSGKSLTVSGIASTVDAIFWYARDLRTRFGNVIVSSIKAKYSEDGETITGYNFDLLVK